ncbi:Multidrug resistance-associated protein [Blattamonas nauphoetae]|uniref:Multidrug resistance-associated protein n=1 Tax=Blattamonas nauphoetae TaxID=2049346 RepID=A0ABQ9XRY9_9EUKA|nr:Multidrug resistance-associated protein [Blattamonas nauphoetae]
MTSVDIYRKASLLSKAFYFFARDSSVLLGPKNKSPQSKDTESFSPPILSNCSYTRDTDQFMAIVRRVHKSRQKHFLIIACMIFMIPHFILKFAIQTGRSAIDYFAPQLLQTFVKWGLDANSSAETGLDSALIMVLHSIVAMCYSNLVDPWETFSETKIENALSGIGLHKHLSLHPDIFANIDSSEFQEICENDVRQVVSLVRAIVDFSLIPIKVFSMIMTMRSVFNGTMTLAIVSVIALWPLSCLFQTTKRSRMREMFRLGGEQRKEINNLLTNIKTVKINGWEDMIRTSVLNTLDKRAALQRQTIFQRALGDALDDLREGIILLALYVENRRRNTPIDTLSLLPTLSVIKQFQQLASTISSRFQSMSEQFTRTRRYEVFLDAAEAKQREHFDGKEHVLLGPGWERLTQSEKAKKVAQCKQGVAVAVSDGVLGYRFKAAAEPPPKQPDPPSQAASPSLAPSITSTAISKSSAPNMSNPSSPFGQDSSTIGAKEPAGKTIMEGLMKVLLFKSSQPPKHYSTSFGLDTLDFVPLKITSSISRPEPVYIQSPLSPSPPVSPQTSTTLTSISFELKEHKHYALLGPVGCGKSLLLSTLAGKADLFGGTGIVRGQPILLPQSPIVLETTLRENILFGLEYDKDTFEKTVHACCLVDDIKQMREKDLTQVGKKGGLLSGGQRQRLCLARICYSLLFSSKDKTHSIQESPVLLLDDPVSACDMRVTRWIEQHVFNGVMKNDTILMATHSDALAKRFGTMLEMKDGQIQERVLSETAENKKGHEVDGELDVLSDDEHKPQSGPTEEVSEITREAASDENDSGVRLRKNSQEKQKTKEITSEEQTGMKQSPKSGKKDGDTKGTSERKKEKRSKGNTHSKETESAEGESQKAPSDKKEAEKKKKKKLTDIPLSTFVFLFKHFSLPLFIVSYACGFVADWIKIQRREFTAEGQARQANKTAQRKRGGQHKRRTKSTNTTHTAEVVNATATLLNATIDILESKLNATNATTDSSSPIQTETSLPETKRRRPRKHRPPPTPFVTAFTADTIRSYFVYSAAIIALRFVRSYLNHDLTAQNERRLTDNVLSVYLGAPIHVYQTAEKGTLSQLFTRDIRSITSAHSNPLFSFVGSVQPVIAETLALFMQMPSMSPVFLVLIASSVYLEFQTRSFINARRSQDRKQMTRMNYVSEVRNAGQAIQQLNREASFFATVSKHEDSKRASSFYFHACQSWVRQKYDVLRACLPLITWVFAALKKARTGETVIIQTLLSSTKRSMTVSRRLARTWTALEEGMEAVQRVEKALEVEQENSHFTAENEADSLSTEWAQSGTVSMKGVSAKYTPKGECILKDVNLDIGSGQRVGVVGRTGSGKSTLMLTLLNLNILEAGTVSIGGKDLSQINTRVLRRNIAVVQQDVVLTNDTIRKNLDPHHEYTDDVLLANLDKVEMADVVRDLPKGLETSLSDSTNMLSAGQRQLLCVCRALMKNAKLVLLDEPSSNVDSQTDLMMHRVMKAGWEGATMMIVAHRLTTVADADVTVVVDAGRVVEAGKTYDLLTTQGSALQSLALNSGQAYLDQLISIAQHSSHVVK